MQLIMCYEEWDDADYPGIAVETLIRVVEAKEDNVQYLASRFSDNIYFFLDVMLTYDGVMDAHRKGPNVKRRLDNGFREVPGRRTLDDKFDYPHITDRYLQ